MVDDFPSDPPGTVFPPFNGGENRIEDVIAKSYSLDPDLRGEAVWELSFYKEIEALNRIREALTDTWSTVRVNALEALESFHDTDSLTLIVKCLDDEEEIVRSAARFALGSLADRERADILRSSLINLSEREILDVKIQLYRLGDLEYLSDILDGLKNTNDYLMQYTVMNGLYHILNKENCAEIKKGFIAARNARNARSVSIDLEKRIKYIEEYC